MSIFSVHCSHYFIVIFSHPASGFFAHPKDILFYRKIGIITTISVYGLSESIPVDIVKLSNVALSFLISDKTNITQIKYKSPYKGNAQKRLSKKTYKPIEANQVNAILFDIKTNFFTVKKPYREMV